MCPFVIVTQQSKWSEHFNVSCRNSLISSLYLKYFSFILSCNGNIYFEFPLNDPQQNLTLDKVTEVHIPFLPEKKLRGKCDIMTNETFPRSDCGNRKVFHNEPQTVGGWMWSNANVMTVDNDNEPLPRSGWWGLPGGPVMVSTLSHIYNVTKQTDPHSAPLSKYFDQNSSSPPLCASLEHYLETTLTNVDVEHHVVW